MENELYNGWKTTMKYVVGTLIIFFIVFGIMGGFNKYFGTILERKVFEESYQKQAGDNSRLNMYKAQLAGIESQLMFDGEDEDLLKQRAMLKMQIQSIRNGQF